MHFVFFLSLQIINFVLVKVFFSPLYLQKLIKIMIGKNLSDLTVSILSCVMLVLLFGCDGSGTHHFTPDQRHAADSLAKAAKSPSALDSLGQRMKDSEDRLGEMAVLREKGKRLRNESQFSAALEAHGEGLRVAEETADTIEWVQALNNIGTDYRRMGILDMAQQYHYSAWVMARECSDTSVVARKNRVVSLNGLANIYLTTGNLNRADSVLRLALAGEAQLGSLTGQAINCANLGAIFEQRNMTDSAWAYYRRSMELNHHDGNKLGIALCHTAYGDLRRKAHDYDGALRDYEAAYAIMSQSKDDWHALNALTALANVWQLKGDNTKANMYLDKARSVAETIGSKEHLAEIYKIYYKMYKRQGDYRAALAAGEQAVSLKDSLLDMDKVNRMQNATLMLERGSQARHMEEANEQLTNEKFARRTTLIISFFVFAMMGIFIAFLIHARHVRTRSHQALKKLNKMRETFFTNITHEFRTPLTVILGLSRDLQQPATTDEVKQTGKTIERQGNRMLHLINQLLDLSKIKSEIGLPDWRHGNLVPYVSMIVETHTAYARRLGIQLQFVPHEQEIDTDFVPDYINKVVSNLLSNALKFTPKGGKVNVILQQKDKHILLDVSDTGRGIPAANLPHIFEEFYQTSQGGDGVGTGVGLAFVRQIVKSLDGTIHVESREGQGSVFHIVLPLREDKLTPALDTDTSPERTDDGMLDEIALTPDTAKTQPIPHPDADKKVDDKAPRVLIVEDNADIAAFISKHLRQHYRLAYATNGLEGYERARQLTPDLIITDLMMPEMDGLALCRKIRQDEVTSHIPIIVVTAKVSESERIEGLKAGADAYLAKPFNSEELTTRVEKLLEQRRLLRKKYAAELDAMMAQAQQLATGTDTDGDKPKSHPSDADHKFLMKVTDCVYVMLNGRKNVDVTAVANRLCMTYGQFNRKLSALTGYTPAQYIQRIKVKKAQRMLDAHPELVFNDVADQCGFADYSSFVRAFKNVCGMTPTQYVRRDV